NKGFGYACNIGVKYCKNKIFILLNNDVKVDKNFISPLLKHFNQSDIFSVSCLDINEYRKNPEKPFYILYSSGGHSAYDKEKFLSLGGFHQLYFPFYCEDRDIGYRAWKMGWRNILEPKSIVYHQKEMTSKKFDKRYVAMIKFKNRIIFFLTCFDSPFLIFVFIIKEIINAFFSFKWYCFSSFFWIYKNKDKIIEKRKKEKNFWKYPDKKVIKVACFFTIELKV
ncbi:MAG: glycosyltransferase, partial [Candidatus Omnitrophica bacterium]|nr:glycosyltransferase [Candidatus Omnitrophota bacterium]